MSKVAIQGNASGTGTFTIAAPNSNTDRTLTLPDEAGTVLTSASNLTGVTGAGVPDAIDVNASAPADSLAIDASGNVGIGTTSPASALNISGDGAGAGTNTVFRIDNTGSSTNIEVGSAGVFSYVGSFANHPVAFYTNSAERMRIDSNGNSFFGTTSGVSPEGYAKISGKATTNNVVLALEGYTGNGAWVQKMGVTTGTGTRNMIGFCDTSSATVGGITHNGSSVSYATTSDYRLKENVVDMTGAITRVKSLSPKRFNFIADDDDTTVDGFLAHEAQTVVPESVNGTHNEVDDEGNPVYQGIDQSKLIPLLTGALQEAIAKIETLETTVADLQTRVTALEAN